MKGVIVLLSGKYHMGSLVAIFFALGIGILIGGSLGQQWMFQTEQHTLSVLMEKYENQMEENQKLHKDVSSLQLIQQTVVPMIEDKRIVWIRPQSLQNDILAKMMISAGVDWEETEADSWLVDSNNVRSVSGIDSNNEGGAQEADSEHTDMIIISDPQQIDIFTRLRSQLKKGDLNEFTEQASSAPQGLDHRTGVE